MSDVLDRAFESLTRDLAHSSGPGAAAAMAAARTRRRTRVGAVALATLVAVGGGLTVPRVLFPEDGVAADGGSARFDTAALARATEGWIGEWETWERYSPWGGGGFGAPSCSSPGPGTPSAPEPASSGTSRFVSHSGAEAVVVLSHYADAGRAASAHELANPAPDSCGTTTTYDVDGVAVRHDSSPPEGDAVGDMWLGDVWSVRIGKDRAQLEMTNDTGVADGATAEDVAEALVAGLRDGWTQSGMADVVPQPEGKGQLPTWDGSDITDALAGWQAASRARASGVPNTPCLGEQVTTGSVASSESGTPRGVTWSAGGFGDEETGYERVEAMVDELRACTDPEMALVGLANGVTLATYDTGGPEGHGAIWLSAVGDRAGVVAVDGVDRPMPAVVADDVARELHLYLRLPWG